MVKTKHTYSNPKAEQDENSVGIREQRLVGRTKVGKTDGLQAGQFKSVLIGIRTSLQTWASERANHCL